MKNIKKYVIKDDGEFYQFSDIYNKCLTKSTTWGWQYDCLVTCSDYMRKYAVKSFFPEMTSQMKLIANNSFSKLVSAHGDKKSPKALILLH